MFKEADISAHLPPPSPDTGTWGPERLSGMFDCLKKRRSCYQLELRFQYLSETLEDCVSAARLPCVVIKGPGHVRRRKSHVYDGWRQNYYIIVNL